MEHRPCVPLLPPPRGSLGIALYRIERRRCG